MAQYPIYSCARDDAPAHCNNLPVGSYRKPRRRFLQASIRSSGRNRPDALRLVSARRPTQGLSLIFRRPGSPGPSPSKRHRVLSSPACTDSFISLHRRISFQPIALSSCAPSARSSHRKQGGCLIRGNRRTERLALALLGISLRRSGKNTDRLLLRTL